MDEHEARRLSAGDHVAHGGDPDDLGTVVAVFSHGVTVRWDARSRRRPEALRFDGCADIEWEQAAAPAGPSPTSEPTSDTLYREHADVADATAMDLGQHYSYRDQRWVAGHAHVHFTSDDPILAFCGADRATCEGVTP